MLDRTERRRLVQQKNKLGLSYANIAGGADIPYARLRGFLCGGAPKLTDDELQRLEAYFARLTAIVQLGGVA